MADLLTVKEICDALKISRSTVYRLRKENDLPYYEVGGRVLFDLDEVRNWMKEKRSTN